ncbi:MAG: prepilin-type N-terminal cleavage/methylation domain-containing protein [Planctomycetota bacterium]|nr:prepilin-type N-terminal cleavage/methylation domain-containing protein [Planctomycetota bacterium]
MRPKRLAAFTLMEMLIVIAIIGILAAILIPTLNAARLRAKIATTKTEISHISAAIQSYASKYGDFPPSGLSAFGVKSNGQNNGAESMLACLATTQQGGPYMDWPENRLANIDEDSAKTNVTKWWFGDNQLREMVDIWGNPLVYFHFRDYDKPKSFGKYLLSNGEELDCVPQKSARTSAYHNASSFQIWSFGPNCQNEDGGSSDPETMSDDIPNW